MTQKNGLFLRRKKSPLQPSKASALATAREDPCTSRSVISFLIQWNWCSGFSEILTVSAQRSPPCRRWNRKQSSFKSNNAVEVSISQTPCLCSHSVICISKDKREANQALEESCRNFWRLISQSKASGKLTESIPVIDILNSASC